jgi:hypothetical protein
MAIVRVELLAGKPTSGFSAGRSGEVIREYEVCYCIEFDDVCDGPLFLVVDAIANHGLPDYRQVYEYKGEFDLGAFVDRITPMEGGSCRECIVCVHYTSDWPNDLKTESGEPASTPEEIAKRVEIDFQEYEKVGTDFQFKGFCEGDGTDITQDLDTPVLNVGNVGPIRNSAGCAQKKNVLCFKHTIRVTNYVSAWNCDWDECLGYWNDRPFFIVEGDQSGIKFFCEYPECTLQLLNIDKQNQRQNGFLYYCVTWVLAYDPNGFETKILDAGTQAAFVPGAQDPRLGQIAGAGNEIRFNTVQPGDERILRSPTGKREILDSTGNPVTGEVLLNGEGVEGFIENLGSIDGPIFLRYCEAVESLDEDGEIVYVPKKKDLSILPICPQPVAP